MDFGPHRGRRVAGVTLVELMITVAILSVGVLAAIGSFRFITVSIQNSKARSLSNNLGQEQIEKLKNLSYYMLLVTTHTYVDDRFDPDLVYDAGNYPPQTLVEGGMTFTRATRVDFAYPSGTSISTAPFTSNDTGLKLITTFVIWQSGSGLNNHEMHNLMANPAANPLNASFTGTVKDTSNNAIRDALVQVVDNPNWFGFSNASGVYQFNVSQGSYTLTCSTHGYFPSTTGNYQSVASGEAKTVNFVLGKMSSGTATGYAYLADHLVISQVVGSTQDATAFFQEYVEVFNPSSYTWTIASDAATAVIDLKYQRRGGSLTTIAMDYSTLTIGPGQHYLFANTGTVTAVGVARTADAVFSASNADFPNLIDINTDAGNDAAGVGLALVSDGSWIDRVGWKKAGNDPPLIEGDAINQFVGLEDDEQYVRISGPYGVVSGQGRAYDTHDNTTDFETDGRQPMVYPPRNSSDSEPVVSGTPATGALISVNDSLSQTGTCTDTTVNGKPACSFTVPSIATGTWTLIVSSGTYYEEISSVTMTASVSTGVPNGATYPTWAVTGATTTILNDTTSYAFISGVVTDANGTPLPGIVVGAGGQTRNTSSAGRYYVSVPEGDVRVTANYNNANMAYTSQSSDLTGLTAGTLYDLPSGNPSTWFTLSLGGILRGYFRTGSNTPLPGRVAVALLGGNQVGQAVSGSNGYFYLSNLTTGTYTITPALDPAESASPSSVTVTLSSTGTATTVSTFTVTNGLAEITGQVISSSSEPITTGVLVVASSTTLTGGITSPPPSMNGGTGILCNPCYYAASSDSTGSYSLMVRSSTAAYKVYGWYTEFSGTTPSVTRAGPFSVTVSTAGQILSQNLQW